MSSGTAVSVEAHLRSGQVLLMITAVGWGLNWAVLKFVLQDWPPLFARGVAGLLGAVGLALVAGLRGEAFAVPRHARLRLAVAAMRSASPISAWNRR